MAVSGKYIFELNKNSRLAENGTSIIEATPYGRWISSSKQVIIIDNNNKIDSSQIPPFPPGGDLTVDNLTVNDDATIGNDLSINNELTVSQKITCGLDIEANENILAGVRVGEEFQGVLSSFQGNITCKGAAASLVFESSGTTSYISAGETQLITDRQTGFSAPAGTAQKDGSGLNSGTAVANDATVRAIISHLHAIEDALLTHGLIGA